MENKIKNGIFIFLGVVLLLPLMEQKLSFISSGYLSGFFRESPKVEFSWEKWWNGSYSVGTSNYLSEHTGFRADLLRSNNQIDYSLFNIYHATWIAPGTNHYLFQTLHIDAYYGKDFVGYSVILEKLIKLKAIQDTLAHMGKSLVVVHSPCKAFFYPEYFSENYKNKQRGQTNFETYLHIGDSLGINQINFNTWFVSMKNKSKELLFTKQGIHWSVYGSLVAADSMIKYIEQQRKIQMPHLVWTKIIHTNNPRNPDDDLAKTLNLIFPFATETFSYPEVSYTVDTTKVKPKVIYIGDSFLGTWIEDGLMTHTNSDWQVWIHFNIIRDKDHLYEQQQNAVISHYDWINAINNTDCLVLMYTSFNMNEFGDGFVEKAFNYFYPNK